ncbi:hypothetical protein GBA52_026988 [Prunus armeniaca]|nr:hypothetical protein GBA52_026988 [Prunus armeniaca]
MELGKFQGLNSMDEEFEFLQIGEEEDYVGLSHWEFVDASDADSEEKHHHNHHSDSEQQEDKDEEANGSDGLSIGPSSFSSSISSTSPPIAVPVGAHSHRRPHLVRFLDVGLNLKPRHDFDGGDEDEGHGNDGDDDDDDGYGLDDELVPWSVGDKFGRQRMRKLGKRTFPKMNNSKRSPYLLVRPGCVRGKHGLGLKHIN